MKKLSGKTVYVVGSGAWGTVIGSLLADNGHFVTLYGINKEEIEEINNFHTNKKYLGEQFKINNKLKATLNLDSCVCGVDMVVLAVPSFAIKKTAMELSKYVKENTLIVNLAKGFDGDTGKTLGEIIRETLPNFARKNVVSLLGPSFAEEVAEKQYTAITASAESEQSAIIVQQAFSNEYFRVYTNSDTIGAEFCSSLKNVIALASGIADGLGCKVNTRAALITRGMAEIMRFVKYFGGREETCFGLAGIGDLLLTCSSKTSRNYSAGYLIGSTSVENFRVINTKTVEGVYATEIAYKVAKKSNIYAPIIDAVYNVLFNGCDPKKEIKNLMKKHLKKEYMH